MTDDQIAAEYLRIEALANKTPQGADVGRIVTTLAAKAGTTTERVRAIVRDTVPGAC